MRTKQGGTPCKNRKCLGPGPKWSPCFSSLGKALHLSFNVFSTKVLIRDTIFTSPTGDRAAILRGHPSHAKVQPLAVQREYLHF